MFQCFFVVWVVVDVDDEEFVVLCLFCCQIGINCCWIVDCEYVVNFWIGCQQGGYYFQVVFLVVFGVLVGGEDFNVWVFFEFCFVVFDVVLYGGDWWFVDDYYVVFVVQVVVNVFIGQFVCLGVIGGDGGVGFFGGDVNCYYYDFGFFGLFYCWVNVF